MAKRFTDTNKYRKPFIRGLLGPYKLLWDYIYTDCDHAGIWSVDFELAQFLLGTDMPVNKTDALKYFNAGEERIVVLEDGKKWFIRPFIEFQYSQLDPKNRVHNSVILILNKYKIDFSLSDEIKTLTRPLIGSKDKDKEKDKDKVIKEGVQGEIIEKEDNHKIEILKVFQERRFKDPNKEYDRFNAHYEKTGWVDKNGNLITNKVAAAKLWDEKPGIGKVPEKQNNVDPKELWQRMVTEFINTVNTEEATTMILDVKVISYVNSNLTIDVKNQGSRELLEHKYFEEFKIPFRKYFPSPIKLIYDIKKSNT